MMNGAEVSTTANVFPESGYATFHLYYEFGIEPGVEEYMRGCGCPARGNPIFVGPYTLEFRVRCKEPGVEQWYFVSTSLYLWKQVDWNQLVETEAYRRSLVNNPV
jgi:hypothetical protein